MRRPSTSLTILYRTVLIVATVHVLPGVYYISSTPGPTQLNFSIAADVASNTLLLMEGLLNMASFVVRERGGGGGGG